MAGDPKRDALKMLEQLGLLGAARQGGGRRRGIDRELLKKAPPKIRAQIARERAREAARRLQVGRAVRQRPTETIAVALAAGFVVGYFPRLFKFAAKGVMMIAKMAK